MTSAEARHTLEFEAEHVDGMLTRVRVGEELPSLYLAIDRAFGVDQ